MKRVLQKRFVFIAKSMLWSILLYVVMMLAFNWDDISNKARGANPITVIGNISSLQTPTVNTPAVTPSSISTNIGIVKKIITVAKSISGIVGVVTR